MAASDLFLLHNTGLGPFLCAEIGPEDNGSALTMLSGLARLGHDPWAKAATWSRLPHAAVTSQLADIIRQMPVRPQVLAEAPLIAARLSQLLPRNASQRTRTAAERNTRLLVIAGLGVGLAVALVLAATQMPNLPAP